MARSPARTPAAPAAACAHQLIAVVPLLMREIRAEMRAAAPPGFTVPQFRVLIFAHKRHEPSISEVAAHLGVSVPTASVTVERLAREGMLRTRPTPDNRRRRSIELTAEGRRAVERALRASTLAFAQRLGALSAAEQTHVAQALSLIEQRLALGAPASRPAR
jgi:DNA-binding MarR family transcriptional regulator